MTRKRPTTLPGGRERDTAANRSTRAAHTKGRLRACRSQTTEQPISARRTQQIGVRMAFGARSADVVGMMLGDAAVPVAIGLLLGIGCAVLWTRAIATFLFQTTPTDAGTFAVVAGVLATTASLAAWIPARRAARVDPVAALRAE